MPATLINLTDAQLQQLQKGFEKARRIALDPSLLPGQDVLVDELAPPPAGVNRQGPTDERSDSLDAYVRRCLGTVIELEEHQNEGGALVLAYPDGSYRQVDINARAEGQSLPRVVKRVGGFRVQFGRRGR